VVQDSGWPSVMVLLTDHGGRLDVQSVVNAGTTFTISLPTAAVAEKSGD